MNKVVFSSKNMEWCTPKDFFDKLNEEFSFDLDVAATEKNTKCKRFFTKEDDALKQNWDCNSAVFCNPPYGRNIKEWVKKAYTEAQKGTTIVLLIPARTDTIYFHDYIYNKAEIRFIKGRLVFTDDKGQPNRDGKNKPTPAPFPSMVVIYNNK